MGSSSTKGAKDFIYICGKKNVVVSASHPSLKIYISTVILFLSHPIPFLLTLHELQDHHVFQNLGGRENLPGFTPMEMLGKHGSIHALMKNRIGDGIFHLGGSKKAMETKGQYLKTLTTLKVNPDLSDISEDKLYELVFVLPRC